jgi:hypothetical protein
MVTRREIVRVDRGIRLVVQPAQVVVISYDLWQRKFNGDPGVIGKPLRMSRRDTPPTIIGVMPPGIRFLPTPAAAQGCSRSRTR